MSNHEEPGTDQTEQSAQSGQKKGERTYWLDDSRNVTKIFYALVALCVVVLAADFGAYHKHGHFEFEQLPGFNAFFGFLAYLGLVLSATLLRKLLKRDEDYYD